MRWTGLTLCVVGFRKGVGKTAVIEELTRILTSKGYTVATVKHCLHPIDIPGKDTVRHMDAGALATLAVSDLKIALFLTRRSRALEDYLSLLPPASFTLIEGFKNLEYPKILCLAKDTKIVEADLPRNVIALVSRDTTSNFKPPLRLPLFHIGNLEPLADVLVEQALDRVERLLGRLDCGRCGFENCRSFALAALKGEVDLSLCSLSRESRVQLTLDGKPVQLNRFTENILASTLTSILSCLKGLEHLKSRSENLKLTIEVLS